MGKDSEIESRPPVQIEVRDRAFVGQIRDEAEWPLARTRYTPLFLNASNGETSFEPFDREVSGSYDPVAGEQMVFEHVFEEDIELTGYMNLTLWVEAQGSDDLDLFAGLQKFDENGEYVGFPFFAFHTDGPVALGWLRASHRALDAERSTPYQPYHSHDDEQLLEPGEVVEVQIEIWPSSTLFKKGETLRVVVQGKDLYTFEHAHEYSTHILTRNKGRHIVHTGGRYASKLLLPIIEHG